jgi:hypothetical protein
LLSSNSLIAKTALRRFSFTLLNIPAILGGKICGGVRTGIKMAGSFPFGRKFCDLGTKSPNSFPNFVFLQKDQPNMKRTVFLLALLERANSKPYVEEDI